MNFVLVIDDDRDIREMMALSLEDHGYKVATAANGRDALELLTRGLRPDIIVLDLMMPVMSGWALREKMLSDPAIAAIPTIVITGDTKATDHAALHASAYLTKPFNLNELLGVVANAHVEVRADVPPHE